MADHEVGARVLIVRETSSVIGRIGGALLATMVMLLAGCGPPYLSDTYATSTPKPPSLDTRDLARTPVVVLAFVAPANLQGLSPTLSHALSGALAEVTPAIREIPAAETLNRLTDKGLATEYADLRAGFARNGMLDRQPLATDWIRTWLAIRAAARACTVRRRDTRQVRGGRHQVGQEQGDDAAAVAAALGLADRSYRLGVVWRRHHVERPFEPDANRCPGGNRKETAGSHASGWFARIEEGNQIYRGSLSGGGPSRGSSGSCASGPA